MTILIITILVILTNNIATSPRWESVLHPRYIILLNGIKQKLFALKATLFKAGNPIYNTTSKQTGRLSGISQLIQIKKRLITNPIRLKAQNFVSANMQIFQLLT